MTTGVHSTISAHDFFEPQLEKGAAVYLLQQVLHDWSDECCIKILQNLRSAAGPDSLLIVVDCIISHACDDPEDVKKIPGATFPVPPSPILRNLGAANTLPYMSDLIVRLAVLSMAESYLAC